MLKIGLTGGIGSGKTTVANLFAELGVPIIDTDLIAREVIAPHTSGWQAILEHFGDEIIDPHTEEVNRRRLRSIIFANPTEKQWLEDLLHPLIRTQVNLRTAQVQADYCIIVIPLLVETEYDYELDRILVVDADPEQQIARVIVRDQVDAAHVATIIDKQISREQRLQAADDVIDNTRENIELLRTEVSALHQFYLELSKQ